MNAVVVELDLLDKAELRQRWQLVLGAAPPPRLSRDVM